MNTRVTMRDVASAVGVSPMTVSRAFRDDKTVSAETRAKVREVARQLGYVYDSTATAFRTQKSGFVAVTLPSVNNANFAETYRGMTNAFARSGMQVLLGATNYRVEREQELVRQLLARNPEALVMTGGNHSAETRALVGALTIPVIEMWDLPPEPLGHAIGFSNAQAMALIVDHLADTGRTRLAFMGASEGADLRGAERRAGVIARAEARGLPPVHLLDAGPAPVSMRDGAACLRARHRELTEIDALLCVSDTVAFGALSECKRLGLSVPGDLAITGFGQFDVAVVSEPQITTVDVKARRIGEVVAETLDRLFEGNDVPRHTDLGMELILGGTS
ncbi:MAG: substrate-binding domain-containing protein [Pseudomonadota bacterium]